MADVDDVRNALAANAAGPKRVTSGSTTVEQHSVSDQVAAAGYLAKSAAKSGTGLGIRLRRLVSRPDL